MSKRNGPDPLFEEWWEIAVLTHRPGPLDLGPINEKWEELWARITTAETSSVGIETIAAMAGTGFYLAMEEGRPQKALEQLDYFFQHPNADQGNYVTHVTLRAYRALCLIELGHVSEAFQVVRNDLHSPVRKHAYMATVHCKGIVETSLAKADADQPVSPEILSFAEEVLKTKSPKGRYWKRVHAEMTARELARLVCAAYGSVDDTDELFSN